MSSIRFHTKDFDEVYVSGAERVYMLNLINEISTGILRSGARRNE